MLEEGVANQEEVLVLARQAALVDNEVAFVVVRLIQVLLRIYFEHVVAHLESHWLHLRGHVVARVLHMAERLV